jgi:nucleoside-diphosphate-sugar epimerase
MDNPPLAANRGGGGGGSGSDMHGGCDGGGSAVEAGIMEFSVVITGVNGFIGSHLRDECARRNWAIHGTSRADSTAATVALLQRVRPQIIFHAAAELRDNAGMVETNVLLTHAILEYCRQAVSTHGLKRLVVFGSSSEYGRKQSPMSESDVLEPETIYEGTKAAATMLARAYSHTHTIPIIVIRPFTVYGPREKPTKLLQVLLRLPVTIKLSEGMHDYVYISDFVAAVFKVVDSCKKLFDLVNIGSGVQTSNADVVRCVERLSGHIFEVEAAPCKPYDSMSWVCDTSYVTSEYDVTLGTTLEKGISLLLAERLAK